MCHLDCNLNLLKLNYNVSWGKKKNGNFHVM